MEKPSKTECSRGARECVRLLKNRKKFKKDIKTSKNIILDGIYAYNEVKYRITRVCMFLCHFRLGGFFLSAGFRASTYWRESYIYDPFPNLPRPPPISRPFCRDVRDVRDLAGLCGFDFNPTQRAPNDFIWVAWVLLH